MLLFHCIHGKRVYKTIIEMEASEATEGVWADIAPVPTWASADAARRIATAAQPVASPPLAALLLASLLRSHSDIARFLERVTRLFAATKRGDGRHSDKFAQRARDAGSTAAGKKTESHNLESHHKPMVRQSLREKPRMATEHAFGQRQCTS